MERDFMGLSNRKVQEHDDWLYQQQGSLKNQGGQFGNLGTPNFMSTVDFQKAYQPTTSFLRTNQFSGVFQTAIAITNANANANAKQSLFRGVPLTARTSPYPPMASVSSSSHLTILYAGTVTVFNDISPEKAEAIMSLVENSKGVNEKGGESSCSKISSKPVAAAVFSVSSSSETQSESVDMKIGKVVARDAMAFMDSFCADTVVPANIIPSVPLARKASLVRFLIKRKERHMSTMPYNMTNKKKVTDCSTGIKELLLPKFDSAK